MATHHQKQINFDGNKLSKLITERKLVNADLERAMKCSHGRLTTFIRAGVIGVTYYKRLCDKLNVDYSMFIESDKDVKVNNFRLINDNYRKDDKDNNMSNKSKVIKKPSNNVAINTVLLNEYCNKFNINRSFVSLECNKYKSYLNQICAGYIRSINVDVLNYLCNIFNVKPDIFIVKEKKLIKSKTKSNTIEANINILGNDEHTIFPEKYSTLTLVDENGNSQTKVVIDLKKYMELKDAYITLYNELTNIANLLNKPIIINSVKLINNKEK